MDKDLSPHFRPKKKVDGGWEEFPSWRFRTAVRKQLAFKPMENRKGDRGLSRIGRLRSRSEGEHGQWRILAPDSSPSLAGTILSCLIVNFGGGCSGEIRRPKLSFYFNSFCIISDPTRHLQAQKRILYPFHPRCIFLFPTFFNEVTRNRPSSRSFDCLSRSV